MEKEAYATQSHKLADVTKHSETALAELKTQLKQSQEAFTKLEQQAKLDKQTLLEIHSKEHKDLKELHSKEK